MKLIYSILILLSFSSSKAQGIFQLWGTTAVGGFDNHGVIFSTNASGNNYQSRLQIMHGAEGQQPLYSDMAVFNGKLYGMTSLGGSNNKGIIFEWDPVTETKSKKIDFNGFNGSTPEGSLVLYGNKFYGMTYAGGNRDSGIIFEWDPTANIFTKKIDLDNVRGGKPTGNLAISNGKFYGMTSAGGSNGKGVIFEWDPATNFFSKKIELSTTLGASPFGTLTLSGSKFYGMTNTGGANNIGVIFEWDPVTNIYTKKIDCSTASGSGPYGMLTQNGSKFYGMTYRGGTSNVGVIFEWDPATNIYTKKIDFNTTTGSSPFGSLVLNGGKFYGMTSFGGSNVAGTIFEWDPASNIYTKKQDIYSIYGGKPEGSLVQYGGKFYGMTNSGGSFSISGLIFEWDPVANILTKKNDLGGSSGESYPGGHFVASGGKFYTMCRLDYNTMGAIVEWDPSNNTYAKRYDFNQPTGNVPSGSLTELNGKFYGTTSVGGANYRGTIFEWDPITGVYTKKIDLADPIGTNPSGDLTYLNGKFYGMTSAGGINTNGVIFEWDPVTNIYTKKLEFDYVNGQWPMGNTPTGSFTAYNGKLYAMTSSGGEPYGWGVLFEWDPVTNIFTNKFVFDGFNGRNPYGSLTLSNGLFYGVTSIGGTNNKGVLFQFNPVSGVLTKKIDFGGNNGSYPQGDPVESNGRFYGMTQEGGNSTKGIIYEWDPVTNLLEKKKDFVLADANTPNGNYLNRFPAPVAKGTPGACAAMNSITIDNSNNNVWVPITDATGDAVAEIKANGNNLGLVTTSLFVNNKPVREDVQHRLYLDRNMSITPQVQPTTPVDIRLYLKGSEFEALKNAYNSQGQASGINSINDVAFFKNSEPCQATVQSTAAAVPVTAVSWNNDYVLTASINHFSSFYIANKTFSIIPLTFLDFNAVLSNKDALLNWTTANEFNTTTFDVERSYKNAGFTKIATVAAINQPGHHAYDFSDNNVLSAGEHIVYYRIRQNDIDGRYIYSKTIALRIVKPGTMAVYPNPASDRINLQTNDQSLLYSNAILTDVQGKILQTIFISSGNIQINISSLANGIYFIKTVQGNAIKFIKN